MARIISGPEITGVVRNAQTGAPIAGATVTVNKTVYTDPDFTTSTTTLTCDGYGVFYCYAGNGTYSFTTTTPSAAAIEPVTVRGAGSGSSAGSSADYPLSLAGRPSGLPTLAHTYQGRSQTYNFTGSSLRFARTANARSRDGGTPAKILCAGDSITHGWRGATPYETAGYPARMRSLLTKWGTAYEGAIFWNNQSDGVPDTRYTLGTGWTQTNTSFGFGNGNLLIGPAAGSTATLDFGAVTCDTFEVWYLNNGASGAWQYAVDGGSFASTGVLSGGGAVQKLTISAGSTGSHTLHIKAPATTGQAFIFGIGYSTSTNVGGTYVYKAGQPGSVASQWAATGTGQSLTLLTALAADLVVLELGVNDAGGVSVASYTTSMTTIINTIRAANGDPLLLIGPPIFNNNWVDFVAAMYALADSLNVALVDLSSRWPGGGYPPTQPAQSAPYSLMYTGEVHPVSRGYWDMAQMVATAVDLAAG